MWEADPKHSRFLSPLPTAEGREEQCGAGPGKINTALSCWLRLGVWLEENFVLPVEDWALVSILIWLLIGIVSGLMAAKIRIFL